MKNIRVCDYEIKLFNPKNSSLDFSILLKMNTIFDAFYVILRSCNILRQHCWSALFQKIILCTN